MRREAELVGCNGRVIRRKSVRERQRCSSAGGLVAVQDEYAWWSVLRLGPAAAEAGSAADILRVGGHRLGHKQARTGIGYMDMCLWGGRGGCIHAYEYTSSRSRASNALQFLLKTSWVRRSFAIDSPMLGYRLV